MKRRHRIDVQHKAAHEPLLGCDVLFIAANAIDSLPQVLNDLRAAPVLTLTDRPCSAQHGVMPNMAVSDGCNSFSVNLGPARAARPDLSARLLQLATESLP